MYFQIYQKIKSNELKFNNNYYNLNYYWRFIITPLNLILVPLLALLKISANFCSFLVLITGLFASYIILNTPDKTLIAIFFFVLSDILDCSDGALARYNNTISKFGRVLDTSIDHFLVNFHVLIVALSIFYHNQFNFFSDNENYLFLITGMIIILHWFKKYLNILIKYESEQKKTKINLTNNKELVKKIIPIYKIYLLKINDFFNYLDGFYFKGFGLLILMYDFEAYIILFFIIKLISNIINTAVSLYSIRNV